MIFNSEINPDWYLGKDGCLYSVNLEKNKLEPGENLNIKLILTKTISNGNIGIFRAKTEVVKSSNEKGLESISASIPNYENTISSNVIIKKQATVKIIIVIGLSIGLLALIGLAVYEIKKHYIDKLYDYEELNFLK